jgi:hypothetical protein
LLDKRGFDAFAESACQSFYAKVGRPGLCCRDVHHAAAGSGALQYRRIGSKDREMGNKVKGDIMKTQGTNNQATDMVMEPRFDREAIGLLVYSYWEQQGCRNDSAEEDWFRAEEEYRKRLAAAAMELGSFDYSENTN